MTTTNDGLFRERISNLSDDELIKAFRQRSDYQPQAAKFIEKLVNERNLDVENIKINKQPPKETHFEQFHKLGEPDVNAERPTIISAIVVLGIIGIIISLIKSIAPLLGIDAALLVPFLTQTEKGITMLVLIIINFAGFFILSGLWKMKKWAAYAFIIMQIIGMIDNIYNPQFIQLIVRIAFVIAVIKHSDRFISKPKATIVS